MAGSVNKVILIGNLGRDPEIKSFPSGDKIANFSVATSESWRDRQSGERKERTEWHNISMYRRLAEIAKEKKFKPKTDIVLMNKDGELKQTILHTKRLITDALSRA